MAPTERGLDRPVGRRPRADVGVDVRLDCPVQGFLVDGGHIAGVTTATGQGDGDDGHVAALPVEGPCGCSPGR